MYIKKFYFYDHELTDCGTVKEFVDDMTDTDLHIVANGIRLLTGRETVYMSRINRNKDVLDVYEYIRDYFGHGINLDEFVVYELYSEFNKELYNKLIVHRIYDIEYGIIRFTGDIMKLYSTKSKRCYVIVRKDISLEIALTSLELFRSTARELEVGKDGRMAIDTFKLYGDNAILHDTYVTSGFSNKIGSEDESYKNGL